MMLDRFWRGRDEPRTSQEQAKDEPRTSLEYTRHILFGFSLTQVQSSSVQTSFMSDLSALHCLFIRKTPV